MNPYTTRINRVQDYIEAHIGDTLTLDGLADVAAFSKYHFHRIYGAITGERPFEYITRKRLEKAADDLCRRPDRSITDIALSVGFSTPAAFTKSFTSRFSISPSKWRDSRAVGDSAANSNTGNAFGNPGKDIPLDAGYPSYANGNQIWRVEDEGTLRIVTVKEISRSTLAYVRHVGPYAGDSDLFMNLWTRLTRWAGPRGFMEKEPWAINLYHENPELTDDDKLRVSCCIRVPEGTEGGGEIGTMEFPGGRYAMASFTLGPKDYPRAWWWTYARWLPVSGYMPDDRLAFEYFPRVTEPVPEGTHPVDICCPVVPLE